MTSARRCAGAKAADAVEDRPQELMDTGIRQLRLGLDARRLQDAKPSAPRSVDGYSQQRRLADPRLAQHHDGPTSDRPPVDETVKLRDLDISTYKLLLRKPRRDTGVGPLSRPGRRAVPHGRGQAAGGEIQRHRCIHGCGCRDEDSEFAHLSTMAPAGSPHIPKARSP